MWGGVGITGNCGGKTRLTPLIKWGKLRIVNDKEIYFDVDKIIFLEINFTKHIEAKWTLSTVPP